MHQMFQYSLMCALFKEKCDVYATLFSQLSAKIKVDLPETRTPNLGLRRAARYPLRQQARTNPGRRHRVRGFINFVLNYSL